MTLRTCYSYTGEQLQLPRERFVLRPAVYAVIRNQDHVLLVTNTTSQRYYLPGGGLEPGESLEEALQREVREEAGITIAITQMITAAEEFFYYDPTDTAYHGLQFYYEATPNSLLLSSAYQVDTGEDDPQWIAIESLQPSSFHNHGERLYRLITAPPAG
jgi:8-oxo-dGTP pyrophosphatase MutT (NUDIX family)